MSITVFEGPPLTHAPPTNLTLPQFMLDTSHPLRPTRSTGNPWFIDDTTGLSYNFEVIRTRVHGLANALAARYGVGDNDVVCGFTPNDIDYPIAMWAIHRLGAAVTPANPAYTTDELGEPSEFLQADRNSFLPALVYQIQTSGARLLITHEDSLSTAEAAAKKAGIPTERIILLGSRGPGGGKRKGPYLTIEELVKEGSERPPAFVERRLADGEGTKKLAYLCFSSGTTGKPKAVAIPHCSVISNVIQFATFNRINDPSIPYEKQRFRPGDVTLGVLPMYHIFSLVLVLHITLFSGHTVVVFPKFALKNVVQSIVKHSITHLWVVPPMVVMLCKDRGLKKKDLASVRYVLGGAAPLSPEVVEQFARILPHDACIGQGYGMTETSTIVCMPPLGIQQVTNGSAGHLISGTKIKVIGADGKPVSYDQPGELHVYGPQTIYNSYLNNPSANKEVWYDGGWVRTGDEVIVRRSGDIFIVDRLKEILKVKGFQVAPAELEGHLLDHQAVADAGVVGIPDDFAGEVPAAFIQLQPEAAAKIKGNAKAGEKLKLEIAKYVADSKVEYKQLRGGVYFVDAVPKNPSGKILRRMLRDMAKGLKLSGPGGRPKL